MVSEQRMASTRNCEPYVYVFRGGHRKAETLWKPEKKTAHERGSSTSSGTQAERNCGRSWHRLLGSILYGLCLPEGIAEDPLTDGCSHFRYHLHVLSIVPTRSQRWGNHKLEKELRTSVDAR